MRREKYFFWWVKRGFLPLIANCQKTLEIRPLSEATKGICVGDFLVFNRQVTRKVRDIRYYETLEAALKDENPEKVWPGKTRQEILRAAHEFYPRQALLRGVYVFELFIAD